MGAVNNGESLGREPLDMSKTYVHKDELFFNGGRPRVVKSHCCLCHRPIGIINHRTKGNCCMECNDRTSRVGRYLIDERESDLRLAMIAVEPGEEMWEVDGVPYEKFPDGRLRKVVNSLFS